MRPSLANGLSPTQIQQRCKAYQIIPTQLPNLPGMVDKTGTPDGMHNEEIPIICT